MRRRQGYIFETSIASLFLVDCDVIENGVIGIVLATKQLILKWL